MGWSEAIKEINGPMVPAEEARAAAEKKAAHNQQHAHVSAVIALQANYFAGIIAAQAVATGAVTMEDLARLKLVAIASLKQTKITGDVNDQQVAAILKQADKTFRYLLDTFDKVVVERMDQLGLVPKSGIAEPDASPRPDDAAKLPVS